jgi:hypothetical protein
LLNQLFEDRKRPFYKLCERITLDRIAESDYARHIQNTAIKKWGSNLDEEILSSLFSHSERHPYYLNLLCSRMIYEKLKPSRSTVDGLWNKYVMEERSNVGAEVELLSKNQKKLLTVLSRTNGTYFPLGSDFIQSAKMSKATVDQSLSFLERHDYINKAQDGFVSVLDPLIKAALSGIY